MIAKHCTSKQDIDRIKEHISNLQPERYIVSTAITRNNKRFITTHSPSYNNNCNQYNQTDQRFQRCSRIIFQVQLQIGTKHQPTVAIIATKNRMYIK